MSTNLTVRMACPPQWAADRGIDDAQWRVLVNAIFPNAQTPEAVMLAVDYCRARNLDVMKRPVNLVPVWTRSNDGRGRYIEQVWPSIGETRITACRTGEYAGQSAVEFGPEVTKKFTGRLKRPTEQGRETWEDVTEEVTFPQWAQVTVYRRHGEHRDAYTARVYWLEEYGRLQGSSIPNAMWARRPFGQIGKVVEALALRKAFPEESSGPTAEEMDGKIIDIEPTVVETAPAPTAKAGTPQASETAHKPEVANHEAEVPAEVWNTVAHIAQRAKDRNGAWGEARNYFLTKWLPAREQYQQFKEYILAFLANEEKRWASEHRTA